MKNRLHGYCGDMKNCAPENGHLGAIKSVLQLRTVCARWNLQAEGNVTPGSGHKYPREGMSESYRPSRVVLTTTAPRD